MSEAMWQYTQGEVVLTVPCILGHDVDRIIVDGDQIPKDMVHIPLSKVDCVITKTEYTKRYARFYIGDRDFCVIDSPEVRQALENTMFENVFKAGDDNDQD